MAASISRKGALAVSKAKTWELSYREFGTDILKTRRVTVAIATDTAVLRAFNTATKDYYFKAVKIDEATVEKETIKAALLEKERKKRLQNEVYKALVEEGHITKLSAGNDDKRESISQDIMDQVWNRDGGKCVKCGSQENLEFDHIIPHSKGGATTYRNLQILCKRCNIEKSNIIG
jgi:HNH endonuclease